MKALNLIKTNKTVVERAEAYAVSLKRDIQRDVIDPLVTKKENLTDQLFELTNFTLDTNINKGLATMTKEDCKKRFRDIIETEYQLKLVTLELDEKQAIFNKYFEEESAAGTVDIS